MPERQQTNGNSSFDALVNAHLPASRPAHPVETPIERTLRINTERQVQYAFDEFCQTVGRNAVSRLITAGIEPEYQAVKTSLTNGQPADTIRTQYIGRRMWALPGNEAFLFNTPTANGSGNTGLLFLQQDGNIVVAKNVSLYNREYCKHVSPAQIRQHEIDGVDRKLHHITLEQVPSTDKWRIRQGLAVAIPNAHKTRGLAVGYSQRKETPLSKAVIEEGGNHKESDANYGDSMRYYDDFVHMSGPAAVLHTIIVNNSIRPSDERFNRYSTVFTPYSELLASQIANIILKKDR